MLASFHFFQFSFMLHFCDASLFVHPASVLLRIRGGSEYSKLPGKKDFTNYTYESSAGEHEDVASEDATALSPMDENDEGSRNLEKDEKLLDFPDFDESLAEFDIDLGDWSDIGDLSELELSEIDDLLGIGKSDQRSAETTAINASEVDVVNDTEDTELNASCTFDGWFEEEMSQPMPDGPFDDEDDNLNDFTEDESNQIDDVEKNKNTEYEESASKWLAHNKSIDTKLRFRLQLLRFIVLHTTAGLLRNSSTNQMPLSKLFTISSAILMTLCISVDTLIAYNIKRNGNQEKLDVQLPSLFKEKMIPLKEEMTTEDFDIMCLRTVRRWCLLYVVAGLSVSFISGDLEPLFIGCGISFLRYISEPIFLVNVLKTTSKRPFIRPNLINSIMGSPYSWQPASKS